MAASSATDNSKAMKMVSLRSAGGDVYEISEATIVEASGTIKGILEKDPATDVIPLPSVTSDILGLILEYVKSHFDKPQDAFHVPNADDHLKRYDDEFVQVDQGTLFDLITAAKYLEIQSLLDLTCKTVADQMRGKSIDEIRKHFHIVNDYTEEEEAEVRRQHSWAF